MVFLSKAFQIANLIREYMEVIKAQMLKDAALAPPVAPPHAPAHGLIQPVTLIANNVEMRKGPRPTTGILRNSGLAAPS